MTSSIASPPKMSVAIEGSDSTSSTINQIRPNKRLKQDNLSSSSRFKGVVLQQNGHWGAQIYANHQRIWLGTFKSEVAAAMAYDSAAIKLRSGDSHRNFPWNNITIQEPNFQEFHQSEDVLNMIKDGSYNTKFAEFIRSLSSNNTSNNDPLMGSINGEAICKPLFHKELTPSDVGKLNRLVIPKKHAIKHFPRVSEITGGEDINCVDDIQLIFCDKQLKPWKFRYCYWKSSQSFVFTRGWNRFVKDKKLKAKDIVNFYQCKWRREGFGEEKVFCIIDIDYYNRETHESRLNSDLIRHNMNLQLGLGCNIEPQRDENLEKEEEEEEEVESTTQSKKTPRGFKLFGVQVSI